MHKLVLSKNKISGKLPAVTLPALKTLLLDDNKLDHFGNIADWQVPVLTLLDLSSNTLNGILPLLQL